MQTHLCVTLICRFFLSRLIKITVILILRCFCFHLSMITNENEIRLEKWSKKVCLIIVKGRIREHVLPFCGMHLLDCLNAWMRRTFDTSSFLHSRISAVFFRFYHRPIHQIFYSRKLPTAFILFVSLRLNRTKKKRDGKFMCVRSLLARDHKQGMQSILVLHTITHEHRHSSVVCCNMQAHVDTHNFIKCSASVIVSALPSRYLQSYINTFIPS